MVIAFHLEEEVKTDGGADDEAAKVHRYQAREGGNEGAIKHEFPGLFFAGEKAGDSHDHNNEVDNNDDDGEGKAGKRVDSS